MSTLPGQIQDCSIDDPWDLTSAPEAVEGRGGWYRPLKLIVDFVLAAGILLVSLPVLVAAMALVRLTSRGRAIYSQTRLGFGGKPFTIYKLRTMYDRCEERSGERWSNPNGDSRVTPVGFYLRRTKIDELPQLWNVLRGEMSLVGPRPERPVFVTQLELAIPHYRRRLTVRPGLTGLAQVQLPPDSDLESVRKKLACDLYYIQNLGPVMDFRILLGTANYIMGIPFWITQTVLRVPSQETAEHAYRRMVEATRPQISPA